MAVIGFGINSLGMNWLNLAGLVSPCYKGKWLTLSDRLARFEQTDVLYIRKCVTITSAKTHYA